MADTIPSISNPIRTIIQALLAAAAADHAKPNPEVFNLQFYSKLALQELLEWDETRGLHYLSNKVQSVMEFRTGKKGNEFVSALSLLDGSMGPEREVKIDRSKIHFL
ncbi:hypothetical protein OCU04_008001 [Sclerotinia nivalis]|uniref:Uncharacterized protein n=1 Tax=Sclerotinia nivalis TaxID=352851 RepID=A0A9X0AH99_9HELO|nr:hypothetical protein OCU04_008001 [Sclerotinia nivalis]